MSDIAPFVCAVIHDKVVFDLKEENDGVRENLRQRWKVEIVAGDEREAGENPTKDKAVTYATGEFDKGKNNGTLWDVNLSEVRPCPISVLQDARVFVGGILKGTFRLADANSDMEGFFDHHEQDDGETTKSINFFFAGDSQFWCRVVINGWARESWLHDALDEDFDPEDMLEYLTTEVVNEHPEPTVTFKELSFVKSSLRGVVESLTPEKKDSKQQDDSKKEGEYSEVMIAVTTKMVEAGYEGTAYSFDLQMREVVNALLEMGTFQRENIEDGTIDRVIELHRATDGGEEFQNAVHNIAQKLKNRDDVAKEEEEEGGGE